MSQKRSSLSRLTTFLHGLVTNVVANLVAAGLLFAIAIGVTPIRDALQGFFTTEIWVWALVLALVGEAALFYAVARIVRRRRRTSLPTIREVRYGGVMWPVTRYYNVPEYKVDPPVCPVDKTQLGLMYTGAKDEKPLPVARLPGPFSELPAHVLKFKCLKCDRGYDLSELGYGGATLLEMVQQLALGEERASRS
jgi:hypothetical protein